VQTHWHYGDNHISVLDADVGHGGVSHFLTVDWQGKIVVIEMTPSYQAQVYPIGSYVISSRHTVILLSVTDVNSDGKTDVLVRVAGENGALVLLNNGHGFSLAG